MKKSLIRLTALLVLIAVFSSNVSVYANNNGGKAPGGAGEIEPTSVELPYCEMEDE